MISAMMRLVILGLLAAAVVPSPVSAEDRALIIGVNAYPHFPRSQLTGAVNDARAMQRLAQDVWGYQPGQIKLLLDEQATAGNILDAIDQWLVQGTSAGDRVLLYYSGHGYYTFDPNVPPGEGWRETIAPYDARPVGTTIANMIVDREIKQRLDKLADRVVMFIADACHSGTLWRDLGAAKPEQPSIVRSLLHEANPTTAFRGTSPAQFDARNARRTLLAPAGHLIAWSAVQPTELAEEDMALPDASRHGVFTRRFIEGLREKKADRNGDGAVSVMELYGYVSEHTGAYCASRYCRSGRMTPMLEAPSRFVGLDLLTWRPRSAAAPVRTDPPKPPSQPTNVLPAGNAAGVKLELLPEASARVGQRTQMRITSAKPGWLILLDVRDDGRVVQLFPSQCARVDRQLRASAPLTMPDPSYGCAFTASEPGQGQIIAIVSEDNVQLADLLGRHRDLMVVPYGDAYLAELAQRLMAVWSGDERSRPTRWSLVVERYRHER